MRCPPATIPSSPTRCRAPGNVIIWVFGAAGLALVLDLSASQAIAAGVAPFLIGDAVKLLAAAAVVPALWSVVRHT